MRIKIDQERCIGCGSCVSICPDVFELDENNKVQLKRNKGKKELEVNKGSCASEAAEICPVRAITIEGN